MTVVGERLRLDRAVRPACSVSRSALQRRVGRERRRADRLVEKEDRQLVHTGAHEYIQEGFERASGSPGSGIIDQRLDNTNRMAQLLGSRVSSS